MEDVTRGDGDGADLNKDNRFCSLPPEIISQILDHLDFPDSCSMRLACRSLHIKSFYGFASKYCSAKTIEVRDSTTDLFDYKGHTIDDLAYWSNHAVGSVLERLYLQPFDPDYLDIDLEYLDLSYGDAEPEDWDDFLVQVYHNASELIVQTLGNHLIESGQLVKIFSRLKNLSKIHIYDIDEDLEQRDENDEETVYNKPISTISQTIRVVLDAVSRSRISLRTLKMTNFIHGGTSDGADIRELNLPPKHLSAFSTLRSLRLWLSTKHQRRGKSLSKGSGWEKWVARFVSAAPDLEKLQLSLDESHKSKKIFSVISTTVKLPSLHTLILDRFVLTTEDVLQLAQNHALSLRVLKLCNSHAGKADDFVGLLEQLRDTMNLSRLVISQVNLDGGQRGLASFPGFDYAYFATDVEEFYPLEDEDWVIVFVNNHCVEIEEDQDFNTKADELIGCFVLE